MKRTDLPSVKVSPFAGQPSDWRRFLNVSLAGGKSENESTSQWSNPPVTSSETNITATDFTLNSNEIHVWSFDLDVSGRLLEKSLGTLSSDEGERAARFHFPHHRNRYIAGRGFLRAVLGNYLNVDPARLNFRYGPFGKPFLQFSPGETQLHFNLSHSEHMAVLAVTLTGPIGIDIERVRFLPDFSELVNRFFSPRENLVFQELGEAEKPAAFFNLWTRKEAWLKATGEGISHYLNSVEVSFLPNEPARLIRLPEQFQFEQQWSLRELKVDQGFAASLATVAKAPEIISWDRQRTVEILA